MYLNKDLEVFMYLCKIFILIYMINKVTEIKICKAKSKAKKIHIDFVKLYFQK